MKATLWTLAVLLLLLVIRPTSGAFDCVGDCKNTYQKKVAKCDSLFNSPGSVYYHNTQWHKDCLQQAKTDFDNCLSTCK